MACKKKSAPAPAKKFAAGGVTSANAKKYGRNLARAKNQSGSK
jgi:hypothetical protein